MRTKILLAASVLLVIAGSLMFIWACGSPGVGESSYLDLQVVGAGSVTVDHEDATRFCTAAEGNPCRGPARLNELLTLTAIASEGHGFLGWSGAEPATEPQVTLRMDRARYVTATFRPQHALTVAISGTGRVVGSGGASGIDCQVGSQVGCSASILQGVSASLLASTTSAEWEFHSWTTMSGPSLANPLVLASVTVDTNVTANFTPVTGYPGTYTFQLGTPFNNCVSSQLLQLQPYLVVTLSGGTPTFTFYPLSEVPPLSPVTFTATTWDPATRHAAGMSGFSTTCPSLGQPPCRFCFAVQLDATFSDAAPMRLSGTLTIHGNPDLACGSTCLQRYDGFEATRQ